MRRFLDRLYAASGALAALCLASICALMLAQAFGREAGVLIRGADAWTPHTYEWNEEQTEATRIIAGSRRR